MYLALAVALRAGDRAGPGRGAAPAAPLAAGDPFELDLSLGAGNSVLERDRERGAAVGAALRTRAARRGAAEEGVEDVAEAAEALETGEAVLAAAVDRGHAEAVVAGALLRIGEHVVGGGDLLEPRLGLVGPVAVGVVLHGELAEGALDLLPRGVTLDPEGRVEISVRSHRSLGLSEGRRALQSVSAFGGQYESVPATRSHAYAEIRE